MDEAAGPGIVLSLDLALHQILKDKAKLKLNMTFSKAALFTYAILCKNMLLWGKVLATYLSSTYEEKMQYHLESKAFLKFNHFMVVNAAIYSNI